MKNNFRFIPLNQEHLPQLLEWLNSPHVQQFWDTGTTWTMKLVEDKYGSYIEGFKLIGEKKYPIQAFIICNKTHPIGYIQAYNAYDFPRDGYCVSDVIKNTCSNLSRLAAIDIFLGDAKYVGQGIGSEVIKHFLSEFIWDKFDGCLVDPDTTNARAIRAYEKAGFVKMVEILDHKVAVMIATKFNQ